MGVKRDFLSLEANPHKEQKTQSSDTCQHNRLWTICLGLMIVCSILEQK